MYHIVHLYSNGCVPKEVEEDDEDEEVVVAEAPPPFTRLVSVVEGLEDDVEAAPPSAGIESTEGCAVGTKAGVVAESGLFL